MALSLGRTGHTDAETQLDELERMLHQMVLIDRASGPEAFREAVQALLQSIGEYTKAARVYIFDYDPKVQLYSNTYEWCAEGVVPQIDQLQKLDLHDMAAWHAIFQRGESIIIPDIEQIRHTMPNEYAILVPQGIRSLIAFPIYHKSALCGFIGVDDPELAQSQRFINLLTVVGGHLGSAYDSVRKDDLLAEQQEALEQTVQALEMDKQILEVLCQDYTSVFSVELFSGTLKVLKVAPSANVDQMLRHLPNGSLSYAELMTRYCQTYLSPEEAPKLMSWLSIQSLMAALDARGQVSCRYQSRPNADGHEFFEAVVTRMRHDDQRFDILVGFRDIDEIVREDRLHQKALEKALAEARLSSEIISAISKIYYSIYRIDLRTDIYEEVASDNEVHRLTGRSGKASSKMMELCSALVRPDYQERVFRFFDLSTLADRLADTDTVALEYLAKDGNWQLARFIAKKRDAGGRAVRVLYVTRMVSDVLLRERNWFMIAEAANKANAAKTDFLSRMAHDIRTPMNAVMGFTAIAKEHLDDPEKVRESLDKIQTASKYLQALIDDVLDITQIERGSLKLSPVPSDIRTIFQEFEDTIQEAKGRKVLDISCTCRDISAPWILVDPMRLKQIYTNLLSNAVKYTPDGGRIWFEVYEEPSPEADTVRLISTVRDTGIGMTQEYMAQMYEKFTRAVDTRVNKVRGSGLGLSIVKELVDLMHGAIDVDSAPGQGTTFRIVFSFPKAQETGAGAGAAPAMPPDTCAGMRLLIAEDNDINYEVAAELLAPRGIRCEQAANGAVCVEKFAAAPPDTYDAILMDLQMPVMDGLEATRMIRSLDRPDAKTIPIISLTASAFRSDVEACMAAGMNDHLAKPIDVDQLTAVLQKYHHRP